jgi:tetratricopeptide (TPR) repeat protein
LPAQKLATLYIKTNQLIKAKDIYDKILLKNKVTAEIIHQYAILSSSLCDTDTAEKMLKKVIKMNPNIAKAHKDLGIIYLNKRLFDYAREEFQTALQLAPNDFEILFEYGNFLYSISENVEAERYYQEALEIDPDNVIALTFMALNKLVLNQLDESYEYIMKAVKVEPHHEYVQFCAGRILYARKDFEEAKRYLIKAVEQNPDIETQNTLALTYFELGEYPQALNILKNIDSKRPKSISVLMEIAKCYEKMNDNNSALEYLDKVVSIFPDDEDAHEMIRRLS